MSALPRPSRLEHLKKRGRPMYLLSTALSVAGVIAAIQWFSQGSVSPKALLGYAALGALIAQVDWYLLSKRAERDTSRIQ